MKEITKQLQLRRIEKNKEMYYSKSLKLGQGAFGEVFLGFDESSHLPFACKIISLEKISAQQNQQVLIKKIKDEIINMQIARNQHIVQFYQAKTSERHIYILCQYCNGDNLQTYLKNRGYLTEFEALAFFREILQGFYNLRERNIVHRDIKPANLLMHNYSLKIADLGFSKSIENHDQLLESMVGSPLYMSPQIFERKKYTQKTDIWSLGVIFYEMLYGKNPFSGCMNLMELKQRVKKDIHFPKYPYVSADTKKMLKRIMVVQEKDRIDWEFLFNKYLLKSSSEPAQHPNTSFYSIANKTYWHFRESYFIESCQHLHKILKKVDLSTEQQLNKIYPHYESNEQFFSEVYFCKTNKELIDEYFGYFIERRNKISYLMILCNKLSSIAGQQNNQQILVYTYCVYLLVYKYSLTLLQEMLLASDRLILFDAKFQKIYNKFCYQKFMAYLLSKDKQLISTEYHCFVGYFRSMMSSLTQTNPSLLNNIQNDLSGIYASDQGDKRVINLYLNNYLKKIHLALRDVILAEKKSSQSKMISEQQQGQMHQQQVLPPLAVTTCKLIQQLINNGELFSPKIQLNNSNMNISKISFRKNLNQILYDSQTTLQQNYFEKLQSVKPFEQQSIISFMSKEIKWNSIFIPKLI